MKSIALTVTLLMVPWGAASAQQPSPQSASLADVARAEEARRKTAKKATKVLTNSTLSPVDEGAVTSANATTPNAGTSTPTATRPRGTPARDDEDDAGAPPAAAGEKKDQKYWSERIGKARAELDRAKMFADSLQTKINSLTADIVNLDYPAKGAAERQRNTSVAELERLKKEIDDKTKAISAIEEEARRSNVPSGWLRPAV